MLELFIRDLENLYKDINKYREKYYVNQFKEKWNIKVSIGDFYENILLEENRKKKGSFYTPFDVVNYINDSVIYNLKDNKDFNIKVLDPSCGGGYFLTNIYGKLDKLLYEMNFKDREKYIINNIIYGYDTDKVAILITIIELFHLSGCISENIFHRDFLLGDNEENNTMYNFIIGNPPYIGHKVLDSTYRKTLSNVYEDVFYDKGDLSYCFIKKSIELLSEGGKLYFFTSRYILESLYGKGIREYMLSNCNIKSIVDFYGVRIIKGAGVDNIILNTENTLDENVHIDYFRLKVEGKDKGNEIFSDINLKEENYTRYIKVNKKELLPSGWSFLSKAERIILSKIEGKCNVRLENIGESFQGIITGKDEAFIISKEKAKEYEIERELLKPWIKGKEVTKFNVEYSDKLIIYSDLIKNENDYPKAIEYLLKYKEKLEKRRECIRGVRKWYNIQWGRREEYFEDNKIIFPYKSSSNRFSVNKGNYFSADIYAIRIKKEYNFYTYEFLESILNSSFYEFYIKSIAKKLGDSLYEYYPNKIMKIAIPDIIDDIVSIHQGRSTDTQDIDRILKHYFNINDEEFILVKSWCK